MATNCTALLTSSPILANATYKSRTQNSRTYFLKEAKENLKDSLQLVKTDFQKGKDPLLRFHKICNAYNEYKEKGVFKNQIDSLIASPNFNEICDRICGVLFKEKMIQQINTHKLTPILNGENEVSIENKSDIVLALYECYKISFSINEFKQDTLTSIFFEEELAELAYLSQIESFYEKGIGYPGNDITYKIASPLLIEFLKKVQHSIDTNQSGAFLNFAHAETVAPFAVLTGLQHEVKAQKKLKRNYYNDSEWNAYFYSYS